MHKKSKNSGQSLMEYIIIIGVAMTAIYFMTPAIKRHMQAIIKGTADQLAPQSRAEQDFNEEETHLANSLSATAERVSRTTEDNVNGMTTFVSGSTSTITNTITKSGD